MRPLSLTHLCVSVNVCKQTTPEIPEVTCARCNGMDYLHETPMIWVISLKSAWDVILWLVYFRSLHIYKTTILCYVCDNKNITITRNILYVMLSINRSLCARPFLIVGNRWLIILRNSRLRPPVGQFI